MVSLHKNPSCGYSLEAHHRGASNEYPQLVFLRKNNENFVLIFLKCKSYLFLSALFNTDMNFPLIRDLYADTVDAISLYTGIYCVGITLSFIVK